MVFLCPFVTSWCVGIQFILKKNLKIKSWYEQKREITWHEHYRRTNESYLPNVIYIQSQGEHQFGCLWQFFIISKGPIWITPIAIEIRVFSCKNTIEKICSFIRPLINGLSFNFLKMVWNDFRMHLEFRLLKYGRYDFSSIINRRIRIWDGPGRLTLATIRIYPFLRSSLSLVSRPIELNSLRNQYIERGIQLVWYWMRYVYRFFKDTIRVGFMKTTIYWKYPYNWQCNYSSISQSPVLISKPVLITAAVSTVA